MNSRATAEFADNYQKRSKEIPETMTPGMTLQRNLPRPPAARITSMDKQRQTQWRVGVILVLAILVIVGESTAGMGHAQTAVWVRMALGPSAEASTVEWLNTFFRECGHLTGFGFLGLIGERAARTLLKHRAKQKGNLERRWLTFSMGVVFACCVGVCDEVHQSFLPTRHASVNDVALDTFGAIVFLAVSACLSALLCAKSTRVSLGLIQMPASTA